MQDVGCTFELVEVKKGDVSYVQLVLAIGIDGHIQRTI